jgi:hypothetical protein
MELGQSTIQVRINDITGETITLHARIPTNDERIEWRTQTQKLKITKNRQFKNEGITNRLAFGKKVLIGLDAPKKNTNDRYVNGFTLDGQPMYCNPDNPADCHPSDWKERLASVRGDLLELVAGQVFDGAMLDVIGGGEDDEEKN